MAIWEVLIRASVAFVVLLLWSRILGKKLISQMTFFDFVAGISLGSITGSLILSNTISLTTGLLGLSCFALLALLVDLATVKWITGRKLFNGEPILIIQNGKILEQGLRKTRLTMDQLLMNLRKKDIFYVDEVDLAFLETDGTISVLKKTELLPVTRQDLQLAAGSRGQSQSVIIDGQVMDNSLAGAGKDLEWLKQVLKQRGISRMEDVVLAQVDQQGNLYIDTRHDQVH